LPLPRPTAPDGTVVMEATMFTGWIYDHLKPHAPTLKVAHPLRFDRACLRRCERAAYAALGSQVCNQLLFQHSAGLDEQATVNGLVRQRILSSLGYWVVSHPEICSGDQSNSSLLATISRSCSWIASRHRFGRKAESQAR
ncbi:MAG TPA: hypothetical protein VIX91_04935, partial [Candidatus Acidoferrum sp.]